MLLVANGNMEANSWEEFSASCWFAYMSTYVAKRCTWLSLKLILGGNGLHFFATISRFKAMNVLWFHGVHNNPWTAAASQSSGLDQSIPMDKAVMFSIFRHLSLIKVDQIKREPNLAHHSIA